MNNDISFLTGINDPDLKMDKTGIEFTNNLKIIHLIKTGVCHCPVCGRSMLKNGYRSQPVKVLALPIANVPTILLIKKQISVSQHHNALKRLLASLKSKESIVVVGLRITLNKPLL